MTFPACGAHLPQNVSTRGLLFFTESSLYFFLCLFLLSCSPPHLSRNMRREVLLGWSERRKLSPHLNRVYSFPCYSGVICFGDADRPQPREVHGHPCWRISTSAVFHFRAALCCFSRPLAPLASDLSSSLRPGCAAVTMPG